MGIHTHLEGLSNEIFFEIFDYLHALDIFTGFASLNRRISSLLQLIPLRIIISSDHCRLQVDFLFSHLTFHAHQVISLDIFDTIRDDTSIISLLFNQYKFVNLKSCTFVASTSSKNLDNVLREIVSLTRLVSLTIQEPNNENLNENDEHDLTEIILTHKLASLRSLALLYSYDYLDISNYTSIPPNLKSLKIIISGLLSTVSINSIMLIFRLCHSIRHLGVVIVHRDLNDHNNSNVLIQAPSMNDNDLPVLSQIRSFDLINLTICDGRSVSYILRCMPNLRRFHFTLSMQKAALPFPGELIDGDVWRQMFELYVPCLSKFEFHMSIAKRIPKLNLNIIVNSFDYFVKKYSNWHMVIDRWKSNFRRGEEYIMLRTLNYHKHDSDVHVVIPFIISRSLETQSTMTTNDHCLFYPDIKTFRICVTKERPTVTWSSPLYPLINYLIIEIPIMRPPLWNNLLNFVGFSGTNDDDTQQTITDLLHFVHLPNVTHIEFGLTFEKCPWKYAQCILQACPNVTNLIINTQLLVLSKLIDNPFLSSFFKQIKMIESRRKNSYFPSNSALKLVQRFPSLSHIELQVFSFDNCVSIIDIFLNHLKNLSYIKINYDQDTLLDDPFSCDYISKKRREIFPEHNLDEQMIKVKNNGEAIEIWLS